MERGISRVTNNEDLINKARYQVEQDFSSVTLGIKRSFCLFIFFVYNNCLHYLFTFSESRNNPSRGSDHPESPSSQQQTKMNTLECFETPVYTFTLPDITRYPGKYIFINNN